MLTQFTSHSLHHKASMHGFLLETDRPNHKTSHLAFWFMRNFVVIEYIIFMHIIYNECEYLNRTSIEMRSIGCYWKCLQTIHSRINTTSSIAGLVVNYGNSSLPLRQRYILFETDSMQSQLVPILLYIASMYPVFLWSYIVREPGGHNLALCQNQSVPS